MPDNLPRQPESTYFDQVEAGGVVDLLIVTLIYAVPIASVVVAARYGPVRSRWWRHENPFGFALFVGTISFLAGFIGPMILAPGANQGPLLGIFYTGPIGTLAGLIWGFLRAARRRDETHRRKG